MKNLKPRDVIGGLVIIGGLILIGFGIDGIIGGLLVTVVAFYFGLNTPKPEEKKDGQSDTGGHPA